MKTVKQLRERIKLLEGFLSTIEAGRDKLNPVHFDTTHECGRYLRMVKDLCQQAESTK